ncbi:ribonuclease HIII [Poinsettia branch-inducing phytoplasma]|uniref:ribonuclease HIII n=1 Tax=Poinsettia branch-inducing phytoplasma TaxID=138647 RepID=UPI00037F8C98|nr:ribonuclease HIII [Poinsettia branch-inducing phytoplasma]
MSENHTFKLNLEQIKSLQKKYQKDMISHNNPTVMAVIKKNNVKITFFKTGTCLLQGKNIQTEIAFIQEKLNFPQQTNLPLSNPPSQTLSSESSPRLIKESLLAKTNNIGLDEVGTGDVFGPVVVCAVLIRKEEMSFLQEIGIQDSKKLSSQQILNIAPLVMRKVPYRVQILSPQEYNLLIQNNNLNKIKALLHNNNLLKFLKELPNPKYSVILDQFASPKNYFAYLANEKEVFRNLLLETQAESKYLSVALASIIARYVFLQEIKTLNKSLQIELKLGASKLVDEQIKWIYQNKGLEVLKNISKNNFRNIRTYLK